MSVPGNLYTPTIRKTRFAGYIIEGSAYGDGSSGYLSFTPSSTGNTKTFVIEQIVKVVEPSSGSHKDILWAGRSANPYLRCETNDSTPSSLWFAQYNGGSYDFQMRTDQLFRDVSAYYHLVWAFDTTQATAADRVRLWVNGTEVTSWQTANYPSQNTDLYWNNSSYAMRLGNDFNVQYSSLYVARATNYDGLTITDPETDGFGQTTTDGYWEILDVSGGFTTTSKTTGGTNIGNMTSGGGLAAAFDGTVNVAAAEARVSGATGTVGKQWSSAKTITQYIVKSPSDDNFGGSSPITIKLQGSNDGSAWTDLHTDSGVVNTGTAKVQVVTSGITTSTAYTYHRIEISGGGAGTTNCAELEFYEDVANSFGQNGFILEGATNITAGTDSSGNGNNFTPSGTITATNDSPTDSAADETGNFATLNPLHKRSGVTLSDGNLRAAFSGGDVQAVLSTMPLPDNDLIYIEVLWNTYAGDAGIGLLDGNLAAGNWYTDTNSRPSGLNNTDGFAINDAANHYVDGNGLVSLSAPSTGQYQQLAVNTTNGKVWYGINNTWLNSGDPVAGTGEVGTFDAANLAAGLFFYIGGRLGANATVNFGQKAFNYTPPTGFKAIATQEFPAPTIADGSDYFQSVLYTGTGSELAITSLDFTPDFVWIKNRDATDNNMLYDSVRGATKDLHSNTTDAETTTAQTLKSFDSTGFTLGTDVQVNTNTEDYVAWCWKASSQAGFHIGTGTGNGGQVGVAHDLGVTPDLVIWKARSGTSDWFVWSKTFSNLTDHTLFLNTSAATATSGYGSLYGTINSSQTSILTGGVTNGIDSGETFVVYSFAEVEGFSKFGSYVGNGSTDGPFVYTGFRPAFLMIKRVDSTGSWHIYDKERLGYNPNNNILYADTNNAEISLAQDELLSNGFKMRNTGAARNASGGTYVFVAFAEHPFQGDDGVTQARAR